MQKSLNIIEEHNKFKLAQSFDFEAEVKAFRDRQKDPYTRGPRGESKFIDNAREKYEIPMALMLDEDVALYLSTWDKTAERRMLDKYGPMGSVGPFIGVGGRPCST